jgi:hypothetical protein
MLPHSGKSTNEHVRVLPKPSPIYIERRAGHQYLNFDFVIENLSDDALQISSIEMSVYDSKGRLAQRKFVDSSGFSPSIQTIGQREIDSHQSLLIYNPFYTFDTEIELTTLHYTFTFASKSQAQQFKTESAVADLLRNSHRPNASAPRQNDRLRRSRFLRASQAL